MCLRFPSSTVYALSRITTDNYNLSHSSNEKFLIKGRNKKEKSFNRPESKKNSVQIFFLLISLENEKEKIFLYEEKYARNSDYRGKLLCVRFLSRFFLS